jgi:hypothetical protein
MDVVEMNIVLKVSSMNNVNSEIKTKTVAHVERMAENSIPTGALSCGSRRLRNA